MDEVKNTFDTGQSPRGELQRVDISLILLIACLVRVLHWISLQESAFFAFPQLDERFYVNFAQALASGADISSYGGFRPMLYPLWIALWLKVDPQGGLVTTLMCQHGLGILTTLGIALVATRLSGRRLGGWVAAILFACAGPPLFFEGQFLIVTLLTFLMVFAFVFLLAGLHGRSDSKQWVMFALSGLCAGLCVQARPNAMVLLLVFLCGALLAVRAGNQEKISVGYFVSLISFTLVLLAFGFLNQLQSDRFQLLTSAGGINLYVGNGPNADGTTPRQGFSVTYQGPYKDSMAVFAEQAYLREPGANPTASAAEISSFWVKKSVSYIRSNPVKWTGLMMKKAGFLLWNEELPNNKSYNFFAQEETSILRYLPVRWWLLLGLGLPGLILMLVKLRSGSLPVFLCLVLYSGTILLFFVNARFRIPLWPLLSVGAGCYVVEVIRWPWQKVKWLMICSLLLGVLSLCNLTSHAIPDFSRDFYFQSKALLARGQAQLAYDAILQSLTLDPSNPDAAFQKGNTLFALSRHPDAIAVYRELLEREPEESRIWNNLGVALQAINEPRQAYQAFLQSATLDPQRVSALTNLLLITIQANRLEEASHWLAKAESVDPNRLDVQLGKAILLRPSNPEVADKIFEHCRALNPDAVREILESLQQAVDLGEGVSDVQGLKSDEKL